MAPRLNPLLLTMPLLGQQQLCRSSHDAQAWAEAVCTSTPVRLCEPQQPKQRFQIESAVLNLGQVLMVSTRGSAITLETEQHHSSQLLIPYQGNGFWRLERDVFENPTGESLLYLPQAPLRLENDLTGGVSLNFDPSRLLSTALTMAGPEGLSVEQLAVFGQPRRLLLRDRRLTHLIQGVYGYLMTLDQVSQAGMADLSMVRLDDLLIRMTVLLLLPQLFQQRADNDEAIDAVAARRRLQPLVDWIDAHLDQPIGLSDLEAQVYMSRRNLQYLFRRAHGCTPTQWVRRRRLEKAMQRLRNPQPADTVALIGRSCGFFSPVAFSREFRHLYGCTPSSLLRR